MKVDLQDALKFERDAVPQRELPSMAPRQAALAIWSPSDRVYAAPDLHTTQKTFELHRTASAERWLSHVIDNYVYERAYKQILSCWQARRWHLGGTGRIPYLVQIHVSVFASEARCWLVQIGHRWQELHTRKNFCENRCPSRSLLETACCSSSLISSEIMH